MSYIANAEVERRGDKFANLVSQKTSIEQKVQLWVNEAATLHTASVDPVEKTEIIDMKNAFALKLKTTLGF